MSSPRSAAVLPIPPRDSRRGAAGAAYRWLRGEILAGALPPGAPLSENEVAQRLGVSRTPVREAFIRLENEGLLAVTPQVGTTVAPIDLDAVADGQFLRESIETRTVAMAATAVTSRDAADLKALLRDQGRAVAKHDQAGFLVLDDKLHQRLVTIAGRPRVWHTIEDLKAQLDRVRVLSLGDARWLAAIHAQHEEIVEAVLGGRPDDAALAMGRHLRAVFASIDTIALAHPEYFRGAPGKPARQAPEVKPSGRTGGNP
jgi:GntR family transcriptional regulator, rspAB operon transcriptional repressor